MVLRPALVAFCLLTGAVQAEAQNVLLIVADDLGIEQVGAYGQPQGPVHTPVLDALAASGVLFRNVWSNPVCSPTRATYLTGRYAFRTGIGNSVAWPTPGFSLDVGETTLAHLLSRTHVTGALGKWHLAKQPTDGWGHPTDMGFGVYRGAMSALGPNASPPQTYGSWIKNVAGPLGQFQLRVNHYATSENVDDALSLIRRWGTRPWFLYLAFNAPHAPFHVPPAHLHSFDLTGPADPVLRYKAMVEAMDTEIGRLLAGIRPAVLEETTVFFLGDNGTPNHVSGLGVTTIHKGTVFEGGIRVPLLVAGQGVVAPGRESEALVNTTDLFATILDVAGAVDIGTGLDSVSFAPQLRSPSRPGGRTWIHAERFRPNGFGEKNSRRRAIRDAHYKLVLREGNAIGLGKPPLAFFDLAADPGELFNLWPGLGPAEQEAYDRLASILDGLE